MTRASAASHQCGYENGHDEAARLLTCPFRYHANRLAANGRRINFADR